jgi:hypothetical protein
MKAFKISFLILFLGLAAFSQTKDIGQGVFFNNSGPIVLAVDASIVNQRINSPYVLFMAYMGAKEDHAYKVTRDTVVMTYKGQEYKMASVQELTKDFGDELKNARLYRFAGRESLLTSEMRFWKYEERTDFFPLPNQAQLAVDEGPVTGTIGFKTRMYFKNPGFQKGDQLTIKVWDKKDPSISAACDIVLQ